MHFLDPTLSLSTSLSLFLSRIQVKKSRDEMESTFPTHVFSYVSGNKRFGEEFPIHDYEDL